MKDGQVYRDRLLYLADEVEKVADGHFNFNYWECKLALDEGCRTVRCAIGLASVLPMFKDLGLKMNAQGHPTMQGRNDVYCLRLIYEEIFGLTEQEGNFLFLPNACGNNLKSTASAQEVAENIRKFVAKNQNPVAS